MPRWLTAPLTAAWLCLGVLGAWTYGHNYWTNRGFPTPVNPPGVAAGHLKRVSFFSPSLGRRDSYTIYLPAGYAAAAAHGRRFPVLYVLHGSPGGAKLFFTAGRLGVDLDTLVHRGAAPFIVVLPSGTDGSYLSDTEWANTAHGAYGSYVMDVVHAVDARWATIPKRSARAVAGNSEGGYGAVNLALRHLRTFSLAESWSGYFTQTRTGVFANATPAELAAASPRLYVPMLHSRLVRDPFHAVLLGGAQDPDTRQLAPFAAALRAAGGIVRTVVRPGRHDWRLWRQEMPAMLRAVDAVLRSR